MSKSLTTTTSVLPAFPAKQGRTRMWPEFRMVSLLSKGGAPVELPGASADSTDKERHMLATLLAWRDGLPDKARRQSRIISMAMSIPGILGISALCYGLYGFRRYGYNTECTLWVAGGVLLYVSSLFTSLDMGRRRLSNESWVSVLTRTLNRKVWHSMPNDLAALWHLLPQERAEDMRTELRLLETCGISDTFSMIRLALLLDERAPQDGTMADMSLDADIIEMVARMHDAMLSEKEKETAKRELIAQEMAKQELIAQETARRLQKEPQTLRISFPMKP